MFMKRLMATLACLAALASYSQTSTGTDELESQMRQRLGEGQDRTLLTLRTEKANEIRNGNVSYNGILVQIFKADNPLQLINPAAPPQYGASWDNVVVDASATPPEGNRQGLKVFSIGF
jgi:hypothetical protein